MRKLILASVIFLSACASQAPDNNKEINEAVLRDAQRNLATCAENNAGMVDDRISDAGTIALALSFKCNDAYKALGSAVERTLDNDLQRRYLRERMTSQQERLEFFLPAVLVHRRHAR